MIQTFEPRHGDVVRYGAPDPRRRARRMRMTAVAVTVAVGFSAGLLQQFHDQSRLNNGMGEAASPTPTGPLAYFPR